MSYLLYLMFRCDGNFGNFVGNEHSPWWLAAYMAQCDEMMARYNDSQRLIIGAFLAPEAILVTTLLLGPGRLHSAPVFLSYQQPGTQQLHGPCTAQQHRIGIARTTETICSQTTYGKGSSNGSPWQSFRFAWINSTCINRGDCTRYECPSYTL